jgi:serine/threonine protein kinase
MLARYDLEHELGTGASGAVFRGREKSTGRVVAVKLVPDSPADPHRELAPADDGRARPARLAPLTHPSIAALHEHGGKSQLRYVVMELASGADLKSHTRPGNLLPLASVLLAMARLTSALQHAHERGVLHGDVKPANIIYDAATGVVKLIDFPASAVEAAAPAGTPAYMAPERLCGAPASAASDQFALAVTLYQLACGHLPFSGRSWPQIAYNTVHVQHTDIRAYAPALPTGLALIFDTALAKNPAERYPCMRALGRAIAEAHAQLRRAAAADAQ